MTTVRWQTLGTVEPAALADARGQLHNAAQVVASAGITFLEHQTDDSHPNFGWSEPLEALLGRPLPGGAQVGLRPADLALLLVNSAGEVTETLSLDGKTLGDGYVWLASAAARGGVAPPAAGLERPTYEIPNHAVAKGARFSAKDGAAFAELAGWFANGHGALTDLAARLPGASDVRCWPHHFDLGALAVVATHADGSLAQSIGIGLSPGDDGYAEPYWYVSPWPYPEPSALPPLDPGGHWHTEGYTSAILTGSALLEGAPEGQNDRLQAFLDAAVEASHRVLAG